MSDPILNRQVSAAGTGSTSGATALTACNEISGQEAAGLEAAQLFDSGLYCAESVLAVLARRQGVHSDLVPAIATGLCSGVSRRAGMCGAVSGAVMALGLAYGRKDEGGKVDRTYSSVGAFIDAFEREFGSSNCAELLGCHLGTAEGQAAFREQKLATRCRTFTQRATELAAALIERHPDCRES
jgi:C_GCAxxG_C_C family probable redox protein